MNIQSMVAFNSTMNKDLKNGNGQMLNDQENKEMFVNVNSENVGNIVNDAFNFKLLTIEPRSNTERKNNEVGQSVKRETKGLDSLSQNNDEIDRFYQTNIDKQ